MAVIHCLSVDGLDFGQLVIVDLLALLTCVVQVPGCAIISVFAPPPLLQAAPATASK